MSKPPKCPKCASEYTYEDRDLWVCPECANEWSKISEADRSESDKELTVRDVHGNILQEGDAVTVIKDLKVKGASSSIKVGTKVKNIHLIADADGHNISCRIEGFGALNLKSEFVKKT